MCWLRMRDLPERTWMRIDQQFERLFSTIPSSGPMSNNLDVRVHYDLVCSYD
jgi:hypothetical protein